MSTAAYALSDTSVMITRCMRRSLRDPEAFSTALMLPIILMLLFVYIFGGDLSTGGKYVDYVVPGLIVLCAGFGAGTTAVVVATDMSSGIVDRFRSMPIHASSVLAGHIVASLARNLLATALVVAVGLGVGWRPTASPVRWLGAVAMIVAFILALIWQFRAASAARGLGIRATHSPGWGVGCWFVPIVNLWMPYQALRDCLPHDDPHRPLVLRCWLLALTAQFLAQAAIAAALFSSPVALGISIPAGICAIGLVATAPRVIVAISAAHETAIQGARPL